MMTELRKILDKLESGTWWVICLVATGLMYLSLGCLISIVASPFILVVGVLAMLAFGISFTVGVVASIMLGWFSVVIIKHVVAFF